MICCCSFTPHERDCILIHGIHELAPPNERLQPSAARPLPTRLLPDMCRDALLWNACFCLIQIHATKEPAYDKRWKQNLMLLVFQKMHSEVKPVQSTTADQPETIWHTNAEPSLGTVDGILSDSVLEFFLHTSPTCHAPSNPATRDFVPPNFPWPVTDAPERPEIFAQRPGDHIRQRHLI